MAIEQLRAAYNAQPFRPFTICLADGKEMHVPHREFLLLPPTAQRSLVVATPDEAYRVIDLLLVTALEFRNGQIGHGPPARE